MDTRGLRILTDVLPIQAGHNSTTVWNPMLLRVDTSRLKNVRLGVWLSGNTGLKAAFGITFGNDGVEWPDNPVAFETSPTYHLTTGWNYGTSWWDVFALDTSPTVRLNARIGVLALNQSGTGTHHAQARLLVEGKPFSYGSVGFGPVKVHTQASTTTLIHPVTDALDASDFAAVRVTLERFGATSTSDVSVRAGWEETNTPEDVTSWTGTTNLMAAAVTSDGITFPTGAYNFELLTPTKRFVRFVIACKNVSGSTLEAVTCLGRVDYRA